MKQILIASALLILTGCMSPDWVRLVPENKDIDMVVSTPYGTITVHSRVNPYGTNGLGPITTAVPVSQGVLLQAR